VAVADSNHRCYGSAGRRDRNPIYVAHFAFCATQILIFADDEAILRAIERDDVQRAAGGHAYPLPLTNRVLMQARMAAENFAVRGDDLACIIRHLASLLL